MECSRTCTTTTHGGCKISADEMLIVGGGRHDGDDDNHFSDGGVYNKNTRG